MKKSKVYYDGTCPMCTVFVDTVDKSSKAKIFEMVDIHKGKLPEGKTFKEMTQEIYVKEDNGTLHRNADAILKIIGSFHGWQWVEKLGKLPVINWLLHVGYNIIAQNRHFLFGTASRLFWVKVVLCFGFVSSILLSKNLWLSDRMYPFTPVVPDIPQIPFPFDQAVLLALIITLILATFTRAFRYHLFGAIFFTTTLVFFDQSRLQPWVYQYLVMLGCLAMYSWSFTDDKGKNYTLNVSRFIVASMYFYSGLQKLNFEFFNHVFPWMAQPIINLFPAVHVSTVLYFGLTVPWIEMLIGITLLSKRFRHIGIVLATLMCAFVLWTLGWFGHNWNSVVWPWNIALLTLVYLLFVKTKEVEASNILGIWKKKLGLVIMIMFGVLPMTYFFNFWDAYPSWSLYSGTTNQAKIYLSYNVKEKLPKYVKSFVSADNDGRNILSVSNWSFKELNVPPYPESRIYENIARQLCKMYAQKNDDIILIMRGRLGWHNITDNKQLNCNQLIKSHL